MNLKAVHIVFITCASLLSFVFGGWSLARGGATYLTLGFASGALGVALVVYGVWFWRKITTPEEERERRRKLFRSVALAATALFLPVHRAAWACSVCYGDAEGPLIDAARLGVFFLLGVVLLVQGSFAGFFVYLWRRARRHRRSVETARKPSLFLKES